MVDSDIFRVKIELGNFFSDHKSKAYVSVNRQWKNVRQFHRHIGEIFDVKKFVLLTSDGVYLPAKEHIGIIESGDIIHVIPKQDDTESVVSAVSDAMVTLTEQNINKHLHTSDGATFKAPNSVSPSIEIISSRKSNTLTAGDDDIESVATTDTNGTTGSKRKRVRHRKKKNNAAANDENQMNLPNIEAQSGDIPKSNPFAHSKPKHDKSTPKSNTHVSVQSAEPQNEQKNDESGGNHQSNETNRNDMNSSGNTDEFSVLEFQPPKIEYTRSQLMDFENAAASAQPLQLNESITKLFKSSLMRKNHPANSSVAIDKGAAGETGQNFNDDFWSKATASNEAKYPELKTHDIFDFDYQTALVKAATDDRFMLPFSASSKVDRWLNSGQNPSEYAHATRHAEAAVPPVETHDLKTNTPSIIKADETASTVSNHSAIRAKLLDKTAKLKQNLRKLTNNNQE